jgi:hypothetical protein
MKIYVLHDYGGEVKDNLFYRAGEHTVGETMGIRLIEHGLAVAVIAEVKPEPEPKPAPKRGRK